LVELKIKKIKKKQSCVFQTGGTFITLLTKMWIFQ
jgi:hypothetical protein